jgi:excisionase family DNA binding protein
MEGGVLTLQNVVKRQSICQQRLLSISETEQEYGATDWFWRRQIWNGKLPVVRVGKKQLIDRTDIEAFIEKHKKVELEV